MIVLVRALELARLDSSPYKCTGSIFAQLSSTRKLTGLAQLELNLSARRVRLSQYNLARKNSIAVIQENSPAVSQEKKVIIGIDDQGLMLKDFFFCIVV